MKTMRTRVGVVVAGALTVLGTGLVLAPLAATAAAAAKHTPVGVCHATSSDSNPYEWIVVDADSTRLRGHLMHRDDPNKHWKSAGTWNGMAHVAGDLKRDYIQGLDPGVTEAWCESRTTPSSPPPTTTSAPPTTTSAPPTTTSAPPTTTSAPPTTTSAPPTTTSAPPTTTSAPPGTVPPSTTSAPPSTTSAPPTQPGTVPPTTKSVPPTSTKPASTSASTTPVSARPPLAETGAAPGTLTLVGLLLIALGIATYIWSQPRGKHS